jgi:flagellar biosynthesis/type III secretory pathway protein FliH
VRTANGRIDASMETQLDRIAEALVPDATGADGLPRS